MTSQKKAVRVAVIGLGDMGLKHAAIYRQLDGVELAAVVDTRRESVEQYGPQLQVPASAGFTSVEALVEAVRDGRLALDAVDVCVPNRFHAPTAIAALELGLDVLCEKPVADTLARAREIAAAAESSRGQIMFGFLYRHHPEVVAWLDEVVADLGQLVAGRVSVMRRDGVPGRPAFLNRELTGGGPAVDLLPHALAVVVDALGDARPTLVLGTTVPTLEPHGQEVEDAAYGTYVFEHESETVRAGAQLTVETSWRAHLPEGAPDELWTIDLRGDEGAFRIELPIGAKPAQAGYVAELTAFVARVRGEQAWPGDNLSHGLLVQELVEALYASARHGGQPSRI